MQAGFLEAGLGALTGIEAEPAGEPEVAQERQVVAGHQQCAPIAAQRLRRVADSDRIRDTFTTASRVLIIGAGWIGLEVAATARIAGTEVTVVEMANLPLLHVLGPQVAPVFADLHREHGVDLRLGVQVAEITVSGGKATGARLADGTWIGADAVIVGIGADAVIVGIGAARRPASPTRPLPWRKPEAANERRDPRAPRV